MLRNCRVELRGLWGPRHATEQSVHQKTNQLTSHTFFFFEVHTSLFFLVITTRYDCSLKSGDEAESFD